MERESEREREREMHKLSAGYNATRRLQLYVTVRLLYVTVNCICNSQIAEVIVI